MSQHYGELQAWMDAHFLGAPNPPDLASVGFHAVGVRLIATANGPAAMVLYLDSRGEAIVFYVRPPSIRGMLPPGGRRDGDLVTEYGSAHGYDYAFVSRSDARMLQLLHRVMRSLTT